MKPKIKDRLAWQQAELLMQPALIRVLDTIRKHLETSGWKGSYETVQTPYPGYLLKLERDAREVSVDIWDLCYQICFRDYSPTHADGETREVEIDTNLIDDAGEVDWNRLDRKTRDIIEDLFANLNPTES